jgi:hypothetical protein
MACASKHYNPKNRRDSVEPAAHAEFFASQNHLRPTSHGTTAGIYEPMLDLAGLERSPFSIRGSTAKRSSWTRAGTGVLSSIATKRSQTNGLFLQRGDQDEEGHTIPPV